MVVSQHGDPDSSRYLPQAQEACTSANCSVSIKDPTAEQFCSQNHILRGMKIHMIHNPQDQDDQISIDFRWRIFCDISLTGL